MIATFNKIVAKIMRKFAVPIHGRYSRDYRSLVKFLLRTYPRDQAMNIAIGHNDDVGDIAFAIVDYYGLRDDSYLIDVGCGSGRLARRAALLPKLRYLGTDVSQELLDYAAESCRRPDFRFACVDALTIPEADGLADLVCFFSVGTHMLHEEFFVYLEDARRVLRRGGRIVFSFLDMQSTDCRGVFHELVRKVRTGQQPPHLDIFIGRDDIPVWAELLDMTLVDVVQNFEPRVANARVRAVLGHELPPGRLGQSIAVLEKR